jgi:hypothetical protein
LKYLSSGGGTGENGAGESQTPSERPSFAVPSSSTVLNSGSGQLATTVPPSTIAESTVLPTSSGMNLTGADQTTLENNGLTKQRRPSLARFAPTSAASEDTSSAECKLHILSSLSFSSHPSSIPDTARQLAALDLAHHRYNSRG